MESSPAPLLFCLFLISANRTLFQDRMDIWEEIEAKVNSENDAPVVKTSNKVGGSNRHSKCVSGCVVF